MSADGRWNLIRRLEVNNTVLTRFNRDKIICTANYLNFSLGRAMTLEINVQRHAFLIYNQIQYNKCHISSFRREVDENCALLAYYATSSRNFLLTFRYKISGPIFRVKNLDSSPLKMGPIGCPDTSVIN